MYKYNCKNESPPALELSMSTLDSSIAPPHNGIDESLPVLQLGRLMKLRDLMVALKSPLADPLGVQAVIDGILFNHEAAAHSSARREP